MSTPVKINVDPGPDFHAFGREDDMRDFARDWANKLEHDVELHWKDTGKVEAFPYVPGAHSGRP